MHHSHSAQKETSFIPNSLFSWYSHADSLHFQLAALILLALRQHMFPIWDSHYTFMNAVFILNLIFSLNLRSGNSQFTIFMLYTWRHSSLSIRYFHANHVQETSIVNSSFSIYVHASNLYYQFTILILSVFRQPTFSIFYSQSICT